MCQIHEQAINLRVHDAYQNLENDKSTNEVEDMEDMESTSESYTDSKDSTYQDDDDGDIPSIPTAVDSNDFSNSIENAHELNTLSDEVIHQDKLDNISTIDDTMDLNDSLSVSNMDVPITQLANEGESSLSNDSKNTGEELETNNIQCFQAHDSHKKVVCVMFTQMSAHRSIKLFGKRAIAAMMKELK